jgi:ketosteroid isomerase-like protein
MDAPQQSPHDNARSRKMKRFALLTLAAAIAIVSGGLWAQNVGPKSLTSDPAKEVRALETVFDEAIVGSDVSMLDKITSDDFTFISLNGELHAKAEVLKYIATHASEYEYRKTDDLAIRMHGDAALVTGRTVEAIQENGKDHSSAYRFTHVYIRQQGHWLLAASQPTRVAEP